METKNCISRIVSYNAPLFRAKPGRGEETEGGEEALSPAKVEFSTNRRRAQGEEGN
jgi:hypothetical protein